MEFTWHIAQQNKFVRDVNNHSLDDVRKVFVKSTNITRRSIKSGSRGWARVATELKPSSDCTSPLAARATVCRRIVVTARPVSTTERRMLQSNLMH
jgi:hypothetical protein